MLSFILQHSGYRSSSSGFPNDIALLKVREPMRMTNKAAMIAIPRAGTNFEGNSNCYITGWGLTQGTAFNYYNSMRWPESLISLRIYKNLHIRGIRDCKILVASDIISHGLSNISIVQTKWNTLILHWKRKHNSKIILVYTF